MKYKIEESALNYDSLKIFGKEFVKNNRNKLKLIIENKKHNLREYIKLKNFKKPKLKIYI